MSVVSLAMVNIVTVVVIWQALVGKGVGIGRKSAQRYQLTQCCEKVCDAGRRSQVDEVAQTVNNVIKYGFVD